MFAVLSLLFLAMGQWVNALMCFMMAMFLKYMEMTR